MAYYYPEGYFGPICDSLVTQEEIAERSRPAVSSGDDDPEVDLNEIDDGFMVEIDKVYNPPPTIWTGRKCKERTLPDGTIEYYDCVDQYSGPYLKPSYFDFDDLSLIHI